MIITTVSGFQINMMAEDIINVTPNDDAAEREQPGVLYVNGPGNVRVITAAGEDRTLNNFANDFSLLVKKVFATNTTATGIKLLI